MKIKHKEVYEDLAAEWQYQMIELLKNNLKKYKVDKERAKKICGDFAFDLAMLQDRGLIKHKKKEYRPVICFEKNKTQLIHLSEENCQLHEYVFGNVDEAFKNQAKSQ